MTENYTYDVQIVGNGPASLGLPLRALENVNQFTFGIIGPDQNFGRGYLEHQIQANSSANDFFETIPANLQPSLDSIRSAGALRRLGEASPALAEVADFQAEVAQVLVDIFKKRQTAPLSIDETVGYLKSSTDGWVTSFNRQGQAIAKSIDAVISVGAEEVPLELGKYEEKTVVSGQVLKLSDTELNDQFFNKKIVIIGGSHSAFAVADNLNQHTTPQWVKLRHRSPVKPFFSSITEALLQENYCVGDFELDEGKVNRFDGIRGRAFGFYRALLAESLPRFSLQQAENFTDYETDLEDADVIIQATGYTPKTIPLYDARGQLVKQKIQAVEQPNEPLIVNKSKIFWNGLAVTNRDGVNFFQGDFAAQILSSLIDDPIFEGVRCQGSFGVSD